jgi:hypothetical protein
MEGRIKVNILIIRMRVAKAEQKDYSTFLASIFIGCLI